MDEDVRAAAVRALARLGESSDFRDRVAAGIGLASFAGTAAADDSLQRLILDKEDTLVTSETTFSLARFSDRAGLAVLASAVIRADEDQANWIAGGLEDALSLDPPGPEALDQAIVNCKALRSEAAPDFPQAIDRLLQLLVMLKVSSPKFQAFGGRILLGQEVQVPPPGRGGRDWLGTFRRHRRR